MKTKTILIGMGIVIGISKFSFSASVNGTCAACLATYGGVQVSGIQEVPEDADLSSDGRTLQEASEVREQNQRSYQLNPDGSLVDGGMESVPLSPPLDAADQIAGSH